MTEHLLKTPDERKQPSRSTSISTSTKGSFALSADKPTGGGGGGGTAAKNASGGAKWAVTELLDVSDFDALVPRPAHRFPFTLDGFQKQAVARLEVGTVLRVSAFFCFVDGAADTRGFCFFGLLFRGHYLLPRTLLSNVP